MEKKSLVRFNTVLEGGTGGVGTGRSCIRVRKKNMDNCFYYTENRKERREYTMHLVEFD